MLLDESSFQTLADFRERELLVELEQLRVQHEREEERMHRAEPAHRVLAPIVSLLGRLTPRRLQEHPAHRVS